MNTTGSYRNLLGNGIAALSAAVEVYNRPRTQYRAECFVILLVNAWELLLKATLAKRGVRIFYSKRRGQPYRTLSVTDALTSAQPNFPASVDYAATARNLELLIEYRDLAVHYYNKPGLEVLIYSLAQTAIVNFRDIVQAVFRKDISGEITLSLLPLTIAPPIDPIEFLKDHSGEHEKGAVAEFSRRVKTLVVELEDQGNDPGRLMTTFTVHLVSTKKISKADLLVGVTATSSTVGTSTLVTRPADPNKSHPYRQVDIVGRTRTPKVAGLNLKIGSQKIGPYQFQAIVHTYNVQSQPQYCWKDTTGAVTRYSDALVQFIKRLTEADLNAAIAAYRSTR